MIGSEDVQGRKSVDQAPDGEPPRFPPLPPGLGRAMPAVVGAVLHLVAGIWAGFTALVGLVVAGDEVEPGLYGVFVVFVAPGLWIAGFAAVTWIGLRAQPRTSWLAALVVPVVFLVIFYLLAIVTLALSD